MLFDIPRMIQRLSLNVFTRMRLEHAYISFAKSFHNEGKEKPYLPLVRNNCLYGNEYWLKRYCGYEDYIFAMIEHGIYFGKNRAKPGLNHEWEIGSIITNGRYRKELLEKVYPEHFVVMVGPMIHYADSDEAFRDELMKTIDRRGKVLLLFPAHNTAAVSAEYDVNALLKEVDAIMEEMDCANLLICVHQNDVAAFEKIVSDRRNVKIVTCGDVHEPAFLARQRALIQAVDYTASNSLGTHLGYCVYLKKPHYMIRQKVGYQGSSANLKEEFGTKNRSENWRCDYERELDVFSQAFSFADHKAQTTEQWELCDFYWGFSEVKTAEELRQLLYQCKPHAECFQKR